MTDGSHDGFQEVPGIQLYLIAMSHLVPPLKQEMLVQLEKLLNSFSVRNWYKILYMKKLGTPNKTETMQVEAYLCSYFCYVNSSVIYWLSSF